MKSSVCISMLIVFSAAGRLSAYTPPAAAAARLDSYRGYSELTAAAGSMVIDEYVRNLTTWQMSHGGFYKAYAEKYVNEWNGQARSDQVRNGAELGTIDNNATVQEMRLLAVRYKATANTVYKNLFRSAFQKAIHFLLISQHSTGGWPQMFPKRGNYSDMATYNDNAMVRVMVLARDIADRKAPFDSDIATDAQRAQLQEALAKAVAFTLNAQIRNNGKPTVWCAQHDTANYEPVAARSYELASKSGSESAGIVWFLMNWPDQTPAVQQAVKGALDWYRKNRVADLKYSSGEFVSSPGASLWYRFYEVNDDHYFFCDREGASTKTQDITRLSDDRRYGYQWAGDYGSALLNTEAAYLSAVASLSSSSAASSSSVSSSSASSGSSAVVSSSSQDAADICGDSFCASVIQGESFCFADGIAEDKNGGFSGEGYINADNAEGAAFGYALDVNAAGVQHLFIRYANGADQPRLLRIVNNGLTVLDSLRFSTTGAWDQWMTTTVSLPLSEGYHFIRFEALSSEGPPNVDWLGWNAKVTAASCEPSSRLHFNRDTKRIRSWNDLLAAYPPGLFNVRIRDLSGRLLKEIRSGDFISPGSRTLGQGLYLIEVMQGERLVAGFPARL